MPYKVEATNDFDKLSKMITDKCLAFMKDNKTIERIIENPIKETVGLQPYELAIMAFVIGTQITDEQDVSIYLLSDNMKKSGFNETAVSIGLRLLKQKGFIDTLINNNWDGEEYNACKLTESGIQFILKNIHLFDFLE